MAIIQTIIARHNQIILVEYTDYYGNFQQISRILLRKLSKEKKLTIDYNNYQFHYLNDISNNLSFMCLSENIQYEYAFGFLNDCQKVFLETYSNNQIKIAGSYSLQEFEEVLKELVFYYSGKPNLSKYGNSLDSIPNYQVRKAEEFIEKIELIAFNSRKQVKYQKSKIETSIKYQMYYKNIKLALLIVLIVVIVIALIKYIVS